jgi:hypothetical protein
LAQWTTGDYCLFAGSVDITFPSKFYFGAQNNQRFNGPPSNENAQNKPYRCEKPILAFGANFEDPNPHLESGVALKEGHGARGDLVFLVSGVAELPLVPAKRVHVQRRVADRVVAGRGDTQDPGVA